MILLAGSARIVVATTPVGFRCGIIGLMAIVASALEANPYSGDVCIFCVCHADRLRLIIGTPLAGWPRQGDREGRENLSLGDTGEFRGMVPEGLSRSGDLQGGASGLRQSVQPTDRLCR